MGDLLEERIFSLCGLAGVGGGAHWDPIVIRRMDIGWG